jgi:hypothetical protein
MANPEVDKDGFHSGIVDADTKYEHLHWMFPDAASWAHGLLTGSILGSNHSYLADAYGWIAPDRVSLGAIHEVDLIDRLAGPIATSPLDEWSLKRMDHMSALREALPFSEAERRWLFREPDKQLLTGSSLNVFHEPAYIESVRQSEARLMSNGIWRVVRGRDLMQRWWSWRREAGEYAGDPSGLQQACTTLHELTQLFDRMRGGDEPESN